MNRLVKYGLIYAATVSSFVLIAAVVANAKDRDLNINFESSMSGSTICSSLGGTTRCSFGTAKEHVYAPLTPEQEAVIDARAAKWNAFCKPTPVMGKDYIYRVQYAHKDCDIGRSE